MHALATVAGLAGLAAAVPQNWNNWNQAPARGPRKEFDKSWCGVVTLVDNLSAIEASWTTPTASFPSQADATLHYSAYQWVGIGGDTNVCHGKQDLAQAGTGVEIKDGVAYYYPYYEMFPSTGPMVSYDMVINPGDEVYVRVTLNSAHKATYYWENRTTGKTDTKTLTTNRGRSICTKSAEWIQERPQNGDGSGRPFPDFTTFSFTDTWAITNDKTPVNVNLSGGSDWSMNWDGSRTLLCHPTRNSDTSFTVSQDNEWY